MLLVQIFNISCQTYLALLVSNLHLFQMLFFSQVPSFCPSVIFNLTVVATSSLMEIFLTLISAALNLSTSIFFLLYCLWQRLHVTDRKKGITASSFLSESSPPNLRQQESYKATYSIFFIKQYQSVLAVHTNSAAVSSRANHNSCLSTNFTQHKLTNMLITFNVRSQCTGSCKNSFKMLSQLF